MAEYIPTECIPHFKNREFRHGGPALSTPTAARLSVIPVFRDAKNAAAHSKERVELWAETDEDLLSRIQRNEREALSLLFERYARLALSIGRRILRDNSEAEDLVQEVFLYIHRRSSSFDSTKGSARSWIVQVAYTQALLRRRDLKSHGLYASAITDESQESECESNFEAEYARTVEGLFGREAWRKAFDSLTAEQQETLRLHFFEGYTFAEIAEKLGQSYGNVRNHHYRGLEKLRVHLSNND